MEEFVQHFQKKKIAAKKAKGMYLPQLKERLLFMRDKKPIHSSLTDLQQNISNI